MYKKIMVAVDLSASSEFVLSRAKAVLDEQQADYQIVCCYEPMIGLMTEMSLPMVGFEDKQVIETLTTRLQEQVSSAGLDADKSVVIENVIGPGLIQHAQLYGADCIVMGSHGRHGFKALLGSVTNYVLHHALCDVLAVRIPDGSD